MSKAAFLRGIEAEVRAEYPIGVEANATLADGSIDPREKFFVTFPYPYINGRLHLGHVFTLMKAEVVARHQKTQGKNVLFPFGFHGTGIPIVTSAEKLKKDIDDSKENEYLTKGQGKILIDMGVEPSEVKKFIDPYHWIKYFPQMASSTDLPALGCAIDYRRSFITTDLNPHYDSFVRWQFNRLHKMGFLSFGKKHVIYSIKDGQPCSDADRSDGEGVEIKEYKVALVEFDDGHRFVTFHPEAPVDSFVRSKTLECKRYTFMKDQNKPTFVRVLESFYRNYSNQSESWHDNWSSHGVTTQLEDFIGSIIPLDLSCPSVGSCDIVSMKGGSGIYTSNPNLNWKPYFEPESTVVSRSGDICIVTQTDQWYINYDNEDWRTAVKSYVENELECYDPVVKALLLDTINSSHPWPVSRTFGMGTKLPFDENYLIDSLSDSTIYMAYYTIAHLIKKIPIADLSDEIWNAIFFGVSNDIAVKYQDEIKLMRNEFFYWYPLDLRVSGKDLITNHLTMMLFNHMAIFGHDLMPKAIYANGHILIDGEKMSKGKGNFITLNQCVTEHGADVTRFVLAMAGDDTKDGNLDTRNIDASVINLYSEYENFMKRLPEKRSGARTGSLEFIDELFLIQLNKIKREVLTAYASMKFRDVIKCGFYEIQTLRNKYENPHRDVLEKMFELEVVSMYPIVPFWSQYISKHFNVKITWPKIDLAYDSATLKKMKWLHSYCKEVEKNVKENILKVQKRFKNKIAKTCKIQINNDLEWCKELLKGFDYQDKTTKKDIINGVGTDKKKRMCVISILTHLEDNIDLYGKENLMMWLQEDHSKNINSYLSVIFDKITFIFEYGLEFNGTVFDPSIYLDFE